MDGLSIPYLLVFFRLCLGPFMVALAYCYGDYAREAIEVALFLGLLSDIFDGIIARRTNSATDTLRRFDSQTDLVFWLSALLSIYLLSPDLMAAIGPSLGLILAFEAVCYLTSLLKFGRETCTHSYLSKLWGLALFTALSNMILFGHAGLPWVIAVAIGLVSQLDVISILLILPRWRRDIPSAYHAWRIRKSEEPVRMRPA